MANNPASLQERLDALRKLRDAATPGPWRAVYNGETPLSVAVDFPNVQPPKCICLPGESYPPGAICDYPKEAANLELIASIHSLHDLLSDYAAALERAERDAVRLYIDCEFNGKGGELISMALVAEDGREFYEVVEFSAEPQPWVREHVLPILGKLPIVKPLFQQRLRDFLARFHRPTIVADWPVDIAYLCEWVIVGEYPNCTAPVFKAEVLSLQDNPASALPHNALEDARAICRADAATKEQP